MSTIMQPNDAAIIHRPADHRPLSRRLRRAAWLWSRSQHQLVTLAAEFADSGEWALDGSPTAAHWLAAIAEVETCTTREWIRIGRALRSLPATADAFANREISYAKVRALTRLATPANEADLLAIARTTPANDLARALAAWLTRTTNPDALDRHHQHRRSITRRVQPDGMVTYTCHLPPLLAGNFDAALATRVMRSRPRPKDGEPWPTLAQQYADALADLLTNGTGPTVTEVVLHVRADGATLDDGTPIPGTVVERIAPTAFLRALIHDTEGNPVDASPRRRHPTTRQQRVVHERDRHCVDCGRHDLLHYDHLLAYEETHHTLTTELQLRCAPCHRRRHQQQDRQQRAG